MSNITDYLIHCSRYGNGSPEYRIETSIQQIEENPFYLGIGEKVCHWQMNFDTIHQLAGEEDGNKVGGICFKMTSYSLAPTTEQFSEHIKRELVASLKAIEATEGFVWRTEQAILRNRDRLEPSQVFAFMKNLNKDYSKSLDFLRDYDHYANRLRQNLKFAYCLLVGESGGMFSLVGGNMAIGEHLLAFLEIGKLHDYYEEEN